MVTLSLACLMALSGATGVHAEENLPVDESGAVSPLGKYEDPVTVEIHQSDAHHSGRRFCDGQLLHQVH